MCEKTLKNLIFNAKPDIRRLLYQLFIHYVPFRVRLKAHSAEDAGLIFRLQLSATLATCRGLPPPPSSPPEEAEVSVAIYIKQYRRAPTDFRLVGDAIR